MWPYGVGVGDLVWCKTYAASTMAIIASDTAQTACKLEPEDGTGSRILHASSLTPLPA